MTKTAPPPEVPCPCGLSAPRVAVGVGVDLHACACGCWLHRWWCCDAVSERGDDSAYRVGGDCPWCGVSRWGRPALVSLVGTLEGDDELAVPAGDRDDVVDTVEDDV